jgi:putative ABC transport system ATP-binding protein
MTLVETENLTKTYGKGATAIVALDRINLQVQPGEFVAVMGPSGCGKSTLLHLIGGLDRPTSGRVLIDGTDLSALNDRALTELRRRTIGFIFQFYNLLPILSAVENTALPLILDGVKPADAGATAAAWLERVGLAIARALAVDPALILADEPTGNLDSRASDEIAALLRRVCDDWGRAVLMVTHDPRIAAYADRIVFLKDGAIVDETRLGGKSSRPAKSSRSQAEVRS